MILGTPLESFNDVYEVVIQIPGQVIIGQWMDGSRLVGFFALMAYMGSSYPGSVLTHFEKIVKEADGSCWIRCL